MVVPWSYKTHYCCSLPGTGEQQSVVRSTLCLQCSLLMMCCSAHTTTGGRGRRVGPPTFITNPARRQPPQRFPLFLSFPLQQVSSISNPRFCFGLFARLFVFLFALSRRAGSLHLLRFTSSSQKPLQAYKRAASLQNGLCPPAHLFSFAHIDKVAGQLERRSPSLPNL